MLETSCAAFLKDFAENGILTTAYYAHIIPIVIALFLATYSLIKTKASKLAVVFFLFVLSFCIWLAGNLVTWTTPFYTPIVFVWSWLDLMNIAFFVLGAFFFGVLARGKVSNVERVLFVLLCVPAFVITVSGTSITEFYQAYCEAGNNDFLTYYKLFAEIACVALMLVSFAIAWRVSDARKRIQLSTILAALILFFGIFSGTEYIASTTGVYEINLYGLFVLPLFLVILTFAITDLRLFQFRFVGTQVLAYILIIMVGSQLLFIQDTTSRNLSLLTLAVSLFMGLLLVENAKREAEARLRIEALAQDLDKSNKQQIILIHFITHQIKGFLTKSRNIFAMALDGDCGVIPPTLKPYIEEGLRSDTKGVSTVQEILNAANIKSGKVSYTMADVDLKALIEEITKDLRPAAEAKGLALTIEVGADPVVLKGDRLQLFNALKNLVDNSIKYTLKGSVTVKLSKEEGKVRFVVEDTGVGITEEDKHKLFTEGGHGTNSQKVNVESTGFGLYIVKNIIEAHHGKVWAESEGEGKGSKFIAELPV